jgi:Uma2 family endonuclease
MYRIRGIDRAWSDLNMNDVLATTELQRRRFTVEEYYRMAEVGILGPMDRVELIEGEIVQMSPISHLHGACVVALGDALKRAFGDRGLLSPQNPLRLPRDTVPQPDVVFLRPPLSQYWARLPQPEDVLLLVEVADTSYHYDRVVKVPLYARAGISEVWIVDLNHNVVEVFRTPSPTGYGATLRIERNGTIAPVAIADVVVAVDNFLPPA